MDLNTYVTTHHYFDFEPFGRIWMKGGVPRP